MGKLLAEELRSGSQRSELAQAILAFSNDEPLYTPGGRRISGHAWENMYDPADRQPMEDYEVDEIIESGWETEQPDGRRVYVRKNDDGTYTVVVVQKEDVETEDYILPEDTIVTVQSGFSYEEILGEAERYGWASPPPRNAGQN